MLRTSILITLHALFFVVGCDQRVTKYGYLEDDLATQSDYDDNRLLASPYATGTQFTVQAWGTAIPDDAVVQSSDEGILTPIRRKRIPFPERTFLAAKPGTVDIVVVVGSDVIMRRTVEVRTPNRIELLPAGTMELASAALVQPVEEPRIVVGNQASYLVRYYSGSERLRGRRILTFKRHGLEGEEIHGDTDELKDWQRFLAHRELDLKNTTTHQGFRREWLRMTMHRKGECLVDLFIGDQFLKTLTIHGVPVDSVQKLTLIDGRSEDGKSVIAARGVDADGNPVDGIEPQWYFEGESVPGSGDLFDYAYSPEASTKVITAELGDLRTDFEVRAKFAGSVESSNEIGGCSVQDFNGSFDPVWLLVLIPLLRQRRHRIA